MENQIKSKGRICEGSLRREHECKSLLKSYLTAQN
jgi:hypothetical protein